MPRAPRICIKPGCPSVAVDSDAYCVAHGGVSGSFKRPTHGGRDDLDPRLREDVLRRDGYRCYRCGAAATEIDHVGNVASGGARRDPANLAAICHPCHVRKSGGEGGSAYHVNH